MIWNLTAGVAEGGVLAALLMLLLELVLRGAIHALVSLHVPLPAQVALFLDSQPGDMNTHLDPSEGQHKTATASSMNTIALPLLYTA